MENIIEFQSITKKFGGINALTDIDLSICEGEVHTIVGGNGAGKSTLMNILSGLIVPDSGKVFLKGNEVHITNPLSAKEYGIATVYQELKLCDNLTVSENIFLGSECKKKNGVPNWSGMNEECEKILRKYGVEINVKSRVKKLTISQMQIVEIAKALNSNARILILDEPTSSLSIKETEKLFENIKKIKQQGMTVLFISHRLEEIFQISDRISVLRDGKLIGTYLSSELKMHNIVELIAGKKMAAMFTEKTERVIEKNKKVVLEVNNLSWGRYVDNVSFKLYEGEILGFYGLQGAGRTELVETIYGLHKPSSGEIILYGQKIEISNSRKSIKNKIAFVPEDRKIAGLVGTMDIKENISLIHDKQIQSRGFLNRKNIAKLANKFVKLIGIKTSGINQKVVSLSGGNQQKVVLARCISINPNILIMDEPTRGIDVGAKAEIYSFLKELRLKGKLSVIIVSSELEEIVAECDRVIVMRNGHISGELQENDIEKEKLLSFAFNG